MSNDILILGEMLKNIFDISNDGRKSKKIEIIY